MNKKILLYLALMVLGVYAMPNTVALFAGQHTFYSGTGISCDTCHSDVMSQLQGGVDVYNKHKAAAANSNYTTYLALGGKVYNGSAITDYNDNVWNWNSSARAWQNQSGELKNVSLDTSSNSGICMLCHNATLTGSITHTGIVVRVCDDDRCHGNRKYFNNSPQLFNKNSSNVTAAGYYLSRTDVHDFFYLDSSNQSSRYMASFAFSPPDPGNINDSGPFVSRGHWTCEGCHTEVVVNITISEAPAYNHSDPNAAKRRY